MSLPIWLIVVEAETIIAPLAIAVAAAASPSWNGPPWSAPDGGAMVNSAAAARHIVTGRTRLRRIRIDLSSIEELTAVTPVPSG